MQVRFVVVSRSGKERVIARPLPLLVGRDEQAGLRLPRDSVSRRHCEFLCRDGGVVVRDLGSTNGTILGTQPIEPHHDVPVASGSVLSIGGIRLRIDYDTVGVGPRSTSPDAGTDDTGTDDGQTASMPPAEVDDLLALEEPRPPAEPAAAVSAPAAKPAAARPEAEDAAADDAGAATPPGLADLEAAEEPANADDFGFLAVEPAADPPTAEWPDVTPPAAAPDDEDLNDFFKSLS